LPHAPRHAQRRQEATRRDRVSHYLRFFQICDALVELLSLVFGPIDKNCETADQVAQVIAFFV
jgi:hypothetical protein